MTIYQLKKTIYLDRVEGEYKTLTIKPSPISQKLKDIKQFNTGKLSVFDERKSTSNPYREHVVWNQIAKNCQMQ